MNDCYSRFDLAYPAIASYLNPPVAVPGTLAFTAASHSVGEGVGSVVLSVSRTGGTSGTVGVTWTTSNGTAVSGADFTGGSGSLAWGRGRCDREDDRDPDRARRRRGARGILYGHDPRGHRRCVDRLAAVSDGDDHRRRPLPARRRDAGRMDAVAGFGLPLGRGDRLGLGRHVQPQVGLPANTSVHHNRRADVEVTVAVGAGNVAFARRVSSQAGADALRFYVDGVEQGAWSGDTGWGPVSVPVTQGYRTLRWSYARTARSTAAWTRPGSTR